MIDMQRLKVLREVARHGSFSRAATALLLTPSAVSQQIAALERSLGATVVERGPRGAVLTESGRLLVETADVIIAELLNTQEQIGRLTTGRTEQLIVATFASAGQKLLPDAMTRFTAAHPAIEWTILEYEPDDALALVREGGADLALTYHFDGRPPVGAGDRTGLEWTPLLADPVSVVLPASHRLADRASLSLAELAAERWVEGCLKVGDQLTKYAALAGFEPVIACRTTDYAFAQSLIATGVGVGLVPAVAQVPPTGKLAVVPLEPPHPTRYIGIATARRRRAQPLVEAFKAALLGG
jgi:molybdate transport repressor ModE-like protein